MTGVCPWICGTSGPLFPEMLNNVLRALLQFLFNYYCHFELQPFKCWPVSLKEAFITSLIASNTCHLSSSLFTISIQICFPPHLPSTAHRQVLHLNLSPFPEPTPGSPELDRLSFFLFFHPDSGEQPGKDTLLTIQSESSNQMGSMLFCVLNLKDCYHISELESLVLLQDISDFICSMNLHVKLM